MAKVIAIGLVSAILAVCIKKFCPEVSIHVSIAGGILIFFLLADPLVQAVSELRNFCLQYNAVYENIGLLVKVVGIAYLCEFAIQILKDAGESAIAVKVELAGKVIIVLAALPLLGQLSDLLISLI